MSIISKWNTSFKRTASRFCRDEKGQFAVLFAVTSIALTMASGLALDGARIYSAKSKLDSAVDAAILATTRDLTNGIISPDDANEAVGNFLYSNVDPNSFSGATVNIDDIRINPTNSTVQIDAHVMLPMTLTAIAGYQDVKVATTSAAEYNDDRVEIAMALDVTGSMGDEITGSNQTKMEALKIAAKSAFDTLVPAGTTSERVRIGLVPYSASVNVSPVLSKINLTVPGTSSGCVAERTTAQKYSDNFASQAHPVYGVNLSTAHSNCPSNPIVPMTNNNTKLSNTIAALGTGGYTAGHVGIAWAQYMLSSKWNGKWPTVGSDVAAPSDAKTKKFAIIMTDGEFNTFLSNGNGGGKGVNESRTYAEKLCANMKNGTIKVFSINFAGGAKAEKLMKKCASPNTADDQYFFSADDGDELKKAFDAIAKSINELRLIG